MNKRKVEALIPKALEALNHPECKIKRNDGKIPKVYRGYISSFGAAVTMGSLKSAVAFFSVQSGAEEDRSELVRAMYYVLNGNWLRTNDIVNKILAIKDNGELLQIKEDYINSSLAIKLSLNAFDLV